MRMRMRLNVPLCVFGGGGEERHGRGKSNTSICTSAGLRCHTSCGDVCGTPNRFWYRPYQRARSPVFDGVLGLKKLRARAGGGGGGGWAEGAAAAVGRRHCRRARRRDGACGEGRAGWAGPGVDGCGYRLPAAATAAELPRLSRRAGGRGGGGGTFDRRLRHGGASRTAPLRHALVGKRAGDAAF